MIDQLDTLYGTMFVPDTDNGQWGWLKNIKVSPEDEMIEMLCDLLDVLPKGIALDCGANFGCWSLALAPHVESVYAFEPQPGVFQLLKRTIEANRQHAIYAANVALGSTTGYTEIPDLDVTCDTNFGGISIGIAHSEQPDAPMTRVQMVRIDDVIPEAEHVSFIKADVEGSELDLLKGARRTILRCKPVIIAECDHPLTDKDALGNFIQSLGYNVEIAQDNNFIGMPL